MTDYDYVIHENYNRILKHNPERIHFHKNDHKTLPKWEMFGVQTLFRYQPFSHLDTLFDRV